MSFKYNFPKIEVDGEKREWRQFQKIEEEMDELEEELKQDEPDFLRIIEEAFDVIQSLETLIRIAADVNDFDNNRVGIIRDYVILKNEIRGYYKKRNEPVIPF